MVFISVSVYADIDVRCKSNKVMTPDEWRKSVSGEEFEWDKGYSLEMYTGILVWRKWEEIDSFFGEDAMKQCYGALQIYMGTGTK